MTVEIDALRAIPAEDITRQNGAIEDELHEAFTSVLQAGRFTLGRQLEAFEQEFGAYCGTSHAIGLSSGTAALHLALIALGVGPGDEVITVPNTYVATVFAISYVGATPVFVDVDPVSANMAPERVTDALTARTKVILPVHLYGLAADIDGIRAAAPGVAILEDAAHAHGATYKRAQVGCLGSLAAFSFYPSKLLGALGDGGAVTTTNEELAGKIRQLRYMGQRGTKHEHLILGYQERLDELQAAFLRVKLRKLEVQIEGRRRVAGRYRELLADLPIVLPPADVFGRHVYYMFTILAPERDRLAGFLAERGIGTQLIYPKLVPDQRAYRDHPWRAADPLTVARALSPQLLCLPMFAELEDAETDRVAGAIREFYRRGRRRAQSAPA